MLKTTRQIDALLVLNNIAGSPEQSSTLFIRTFYVSVYENMFFFNAVIFLKVNDKYMCVVYMCTTQSGYAAY